MCWLQVGEYTNWGSAYRRDSLLEFWFVTSFSLSRFSIFFSEFELLCTVLSELVWSDNSGLCWSEFLNLIDLNWVELEWYNSEPFGLEFVNVFWLQIWTPTKTKTAGKVSIFEFLWVHLLKISRNEYLCLSWNTFVQPSSTKVAISKKHGTSNYCRNLCGNDIIKRFTYFLCVGHNWTI